MSLYVVSLSVDLKGREWGMSHREGKENILYDLYIYIFWKNIKQNFAMVKRYVSFYFNLFVHTLFYV